MTEQIPGGKLVRDRIPQIIRESGREPVVRRLAASALRAALLAKLAEESEELAVATGADVAGELADLLEVLRALADDSGVAWSEVEEQARVKVVARGAFRERWFLESPGVPGDQAAEGSTSAPAHDAGP